jgi:hypothetical protein
MLRRDGRFLKSLPPVLFCFGLPMMLADKRPPSSPAHEPGAEPFFWSRSKNPGRICKKTHGIRLINHIRNGDHVARASIPAVSQCSPRMFGYQRVEESLRISESNSLEQCSSRRKYFILPRVPETHVAQRFQGPRVVIAVKSLRLQKNP